MGAAFNVPAPLAPRTDWLERLPPACNALRPYQRQQVSDIAAIIRRGGKRIINQLPTGGGKTHEIAGVASAASHASLPVLILATRTRLVRQIHDRLQEFGVPHGVIAAELRGMVDNFQLVQVASVDTLYRRCLVAETMMLPPAAVLIFDEAHLAAADSRLKLIEQYPNAVLLGFTATPARKSGRSLAKVFDHLIQGPSIADLISEGRLVKPRIFSVPVVTERDLAALPKDASNDYATGAAAELMSRPKLIGDVLSNWLRIAAGKRTLVFACNKSHGAQVVQEFSTAGVAAELLTDQDDEETREAVVGRLEAGQTTVVVNCFLMAYGVDVPSVECIVLARPTRSVVMYLQMVGRGLRTAPGKEHCIVVDHGRVVESLGLPTMDFGWTLDDGRNVNCDAVDACKRTATEEGPRTCPECRHTWLVSELGNTCQVCGWAPAPKAKPISTQAADLIELGCETAPAVSPFAPEVMQFFREALGDYARTKPQKWRERPNTARAACWHATREKFELATERVPSSYWQMMPLAPSPDTAGWLKYRRIKYARSGPRAGV